MINGRVHERADRTGVGRQPRCQTHLVFSVPTYRDRLRLEGAVLGACGALGTVGLLVLVSGAHHALLSTVLQLAVVALLLLWLAPRGLRRSIAASEERHWPDIGSGEPTPLWHVAGIVIILAGLAGLAGADASLRVTAGCVLVGATQTLLLGHLVRREEHRTGRTYYRAAGSRILRGTRLAYITANGQARSSE